MDESTFATINKLIPANILSYSIRYVDGNIATELSILNRKQPHKANLTKIMTLKSAAEKIKSEK